MSIYQYRSWKLFANLSVNYVFSFLLSISLLYQIFFSLFSFLFPRYWKYKIVPGDWTKFYFICLCNEEGDRKENWNLHSFGQFNQGFGREKDENRADLCSRSIVFSVEGSRPWCYILVVKMEGIWKGEGWESRRFMFAFYSIFIWRRPPLMFHLSRQKERDLEEWRIRITQICTCVLLHFHLRATTFDVPS